MEKAVFVDKYHLSGGWSDHWNELDGWAHNAHQSTMRQVSGDGGQAFPKTPTGGTAGPATQGQGPGPQPVGDAESSIVNTNGTVMQRGDPAHFDTGFGSAHTGGMFAVLGDASVKMINFDIDYAVGGPLYRMCYRSDSLAIDEGSN
jgi:hypothetical protein